MLLFLIRSCQSSICVEDPEKPSTSLDVIENKMDSSLRSPPSSSLMQYNLDGSSLSIREIWSHLQRNLRIIKRELSRATSPDDTRRTGRSEPEFHQCLYSICQEQWELCYRLHVLPHLSRSCLGRLASDNMLLGSRTRCSYLACKPMRKLRDHSSQR
ncbi:hypothetical protein SISSUDRAFT_1056212 [Sistotremastrum suecicum HHB10207 ss-3]|uniref:Uncharacterized protein n=1 Tax=Sistotremastrum suecicum HHB10207 ss-3 TaxID=1314776 RepID=A0A165X4T4_9AGAM|nr:hypothetical protein SISSUDRAFT_1056212 [Sistotremastrum suecicum HHB10207 ss-3]